MIYLLSFVMIRSLTGIVKKVLDMPTARVGQLSMARDTDNRGIVLLADFNEADGKEILRRMQMLPVERSKGLSITLCQSLPDLIDRDSGRDRRNSSPYQRRDDRSERPSRDRDGDRGSRSRDGERYSRDRDRDGDRNGSRFRDRDGGRGRERDGGKDRDRQRW
jgi:hypothetical protein